MHIKEIAIRNFRVLADTKIELDKEPCLMIGRNNTGKTSFIVLFEKFMRGQSFTLADFPVKCRRELLTMDDSTDETALAIQLQLTIGYDDSDNLCNLSEFIVDLASTRQEVYILFECAIRKRALLDAAASAGEDKKEFISKHLSEYLETRVYTFAEPDTPVTDRSRMVRKTLADVDKLIDFEVIHAKRNVASSEERRGRKVLSELTTAYFNAQHPCDAKNFDDINKIIHDTDKVLNQEYEEFFDGFVTNAANFLGTGSLRVISNLSAREILENASEVVYHDGGCQLPEHQNGLGHVNILYLLLSIESRMRNFAENNKDIRLLFIEEPEAHTHPQLQYNFARKINDLIGADQEVQMVITTHSPHIVSSYPFENIRYMAAQEAVIPGTGQVYRNIQIKHFHKALQEVYQGKEVEEFQFVKQYLTVVSSELFFADKAIFIEGTTEALLLPYFIRQFDAQQQEAFVPGDEDMVYVPLASQNVAIVEAGANAKAFRHFLDFLGIPALVITDLDSADINAKECKVGNTNARTTTNATIKYYLQVPEDKPGEPAHDAWFRNLLTGPQHCTCRSRNVRVAYQTKEDGFDGEFHARSFEDAFINVNLQKIYDYLKDQDAKCAPKKGSMHGLKNANVLRKYVEGDNATRTKFKDVYDLTEKVLGAKSGFASSILYLGLTGTVEWNMPEYIKEGLEWLQNRQL